MKQDFYCTHSARKAYSKITASFISRHPDSRLLKKLMYAKYKMKPANVKNIEEIKRTADEFCVDASYDRDELAADVIWSQRIHGVSLSEYFMFEFYYKNSVGKNEFLCDRERFFILRPLFTTEAVDILDDKYLSYQKLKEYYKRDLIYVNSTKDLNKFREFAAAHSVFVYKQPHMYCGISIRKIQVSDYNSIDALFDELITDGEFVAEELVLQASEMAKFNSSSVNTLRMPTYLLKNGDVVIDNPRLKIGRAGSFVDNGGSNGILAMIDADSGIISTVGKDEKGHEFVFHPDSGVQIIGAKIPKWSEAVELSKKIAKAFPDGKAIAWDLALTDNGWVVIEGNPFGQFIGCQIADKTGKKRETLEVVSKCM